MGFFFFNSHGGSIYRVEMTSKHSSYNNFSWALISIEYKYFFIRLKLFYVPIFFKILIQMLIVDS